MLTVHYVMVIFGALAIAIPGFAPALPPSAEPYLKAAAAFCVLMGTVLGAISPSATKKDGAS